MGTRAHPGRYDCLAKAEPDEPYFVLLARDADIEPALLAWCRARLGRIRDSAKPLSDLDQVSEAIAILRAMIFWRRHHRATARREPQPMGVWRQRIDDIARELAELAGEIGDGKRQEEVWVCRVDGVEVGRMATRYGAMRLADHCYGEAVVSRLEGGPQWRRINGAWRLPAEG